MFANPWFAVAVGIGALSWLALLAAILEVTR
jgi:hypothetical protein